MASVLQPTVFRSALNMVVIGLVVVGGAVAAWCYWGHHFWTALKGPTEVALADIAKLQDPRELPSTWVKVKLDKVVKSEVVMEETRTGITRVKEEYLIFQAGDRWMIACVPPGFSSQELSGQIWRQSYGMSREAVAAITAELQEVHQGKLFPFELDASDGYAAKWKTVAGVIAFFAAAGGFFGCLGFGGIRRSYRPPRPEDYGLPAELYSDLVIETPADAEAAVAMFIRDAGLEPEVQ
jgi:hypothetical protein